MIGRAAVGGLLLNPLDAIVREMRGTGTKKKSKIIFFLSIEFTGVDGKEHIGLFIAPIIGTSDFLKKINTLISPEQEQETRPYEI